MKEYYEMLEKNREYFERAFDITKYIAEKAKKIRRMRSFHRWQFCKRRAQTFF